MPQGSFAGAARQDRDAADSGSATATSGSAGLAIDGYTTHPRAVNNTMHSSKGESLWTSTGALPQSVTLNLGKSYDNIDMLEYLPQRNTGTTAGNITSYKVYVSTDNVTFTQVASGTWPADPTYHGLMSPERVQFPAQTAQYVRLEAVAVAGGEPAPSSANLRSAPTARAEPQAMREQEGGGSSGKGDAGADAVAGADGSAIGGTGGGTIAGPVGLAARVVVAEPVQARPAPVDAGERAARRMVAAPQTPTRAAAQVDPLAPAAPPGVRTPLRRQRRELQPAALPATLTPVPSAAAVRGRTRGDWRQYQRSRRDRRRDRRARRGKRWPCECVGL